MNTLIIYAHPNHDGHHAYFLTELKKNLDNKKINYEVLDLYSLDFNPILKMEGPEKINDSKLDEDIELYQNKIKAADKLIFIYPTWWQGAPAILKGFIDRVFSAGFAFEYKNNLPHGLLKGKMAAVFSATGGPKIFNQLIIGEIGMKVMIKNVLKFCGFKAKGFSVGSARTLNDKQRSKIVKELERMILYLYK